MEWLDSASFINPAQRQALMFEQRLGLLRNVLTRAVPQLAGKAARQVFDSVLQPAGLGVDDIQAWIFHAGGRDVLLALQRTFGLDTDALRYSASMLRQYGNLSSAFVYFVLQAAVADEAPAGNWWLSSFGAGFSCHGALLKVA
jgi:alkylresorcinol/alkylpyrone synthase